MEYKVRAKVQFEAEFIINDEQLISYFGQEKFSTTAQEALLKQLISETENIRDWNQTDLTLEINN